MPAKSRAAQRLMQAAEHGASFPMARKIQQTMTHQQMRDFAVGSEAEKPQHVKPMHPKMQQRAAMVKEAHAHLGKTIQGFHKLPGAQKMMAAQHHVNLRLGKVK